MSRKWPATVAILCLAITKLCRPPPHVTWRCHGAALRSSQNSQNTKHSTPGSVNAPDISAHISEINGKLRLKCHKLTFLFVYNLVADVCLSERKIHSFSFFRMEKFPESMNSWTTSLALRILNWIDDFVCWGWVGETNKKLHYAIISNDCGE